MTLPLLIVCLAFSSFSASARAKNIGVHGLNDMHSRWMLPMLQTKTFAF
jgi:hypothetical protein